MNIFRNGISDVTPAGELSIQALVSMIKNNTDKKRIEALHRMDYGSKEYKEAKNQLPYVTPHGTFNNRRKIENLKELSGYLYFDIDAISFDCHVDEMKERIIEEYGDTVCLVSKSVGGRGIFFLVKESAVTSENFQALQQWYITTKFCNLPIDTNALGIARPMFIPYDPNLYYNENISNESLEFNNDLKNKCAIQYINNKEYKKIGYTLNCAFKALSIKEVFSKLRMVTEVTVNHPLYEVKPIEFFKVFIPKIIRDGKKHKTFRNITNMLVNLNPDADLHTIQSFIYYINANYTGNKPMELKEMLRTVEQSFVRTKETGIILSKVKIKNVHFNKTSPYTAAQKRHLAAVINGDLRKKQSIMKIKEAIQSLEISGEKATKKNIASKSGLSRNTVNKHLKKISNNQIRE